MDFYYAIKHYMEAVLDVSNVKLSDGARMCVELDPKKNRLKTTKGRYHMVLPLSEKSQKEYFGKLVNILSETSMWSVLIGGLYHELGHLISGEPVYTDPVRGKISNVISDANENNTIPNAWFGSVRYLNTLNGLFKTMDFADIEIQKPIKDQFMDLLHLANNYRISLAINYDGKNVHSLPDDHAFHDVFEEMKPVMEDSRRLWSADTKKIRRYRNKMINDLQKILDEWYEEHPEPEKEGKESLSDHLPKIESTDLPSKLMSSMSSEKAKQIATAVSATVNEQTAEDMDQAVRAGDYEKAADEAKTEAEMITALHTEDERNGIDNLPWLQDQEINGGGHGDIGHVPPIVAGIRARPDESIVHQLRSAFKRMIFSRTYKGRKIDITGRKLHAPNFYQVKTSDEPQIMRDIGKIKVDKDKTDVVLMFDRSGSMRGINSNFCKEVMATFYAAIKPITDINLQMFGFDTRVLQIKDDARVFYNIDQALSAGGATSFKYAQRVALRSIEKSTAKRKIIVMLTDGDLSGSYGYTLVQLQKHAKRNKVQVIVIDVGNGSAIKQKQYFDSVIFIRDCSTLLGAMKKIAGKKF